MYQALYRKWRPSVFDDVYGQEHITSILKNEVASGRISHAYLFCGPRGTGKTTCAKIIAKAANCESPVNGNPCGKCAACRAIDNGTTTDVVEMDAASNNGVDNIRDLRDGVVYTPADMKYRVYIIDEVHMLSISAFNALLKTLEEPPEYVIFILATTELNKIPATVLSRCQRFDFRRVTPSALVDRMRIVCKGEGIVAEDAALSLIAALSQGSFRDALNMLEFCSSESSEITEESAGRLLGVSSVNTLAVLSSAICERDVATAIDTVNEIYLSSRDISAFWRELISFYRDMLISAVTKGKTPVGEQAEHVAKEYAPSRIISALEIFAEAEMNMSRVPASAKLYAEIAVIKAAESVAKSDPTVGADMGHIEERISRLEETVKRLAASGIAPAQSGGANNNVNNIYHVERQTLTTPRTESNARAVEKAESFDNKALELDKKEVRSEFTAVSGQTTFKSLRGWIDVIRRISKKSPSIAPSLLSSQALEGSDGRLYVFVDNAFSAKILCGFPDAKTIVMSTVLDITGKSFTADDIIFEAKKNAEVIIREPIDDIIEKINEESENDT